MNNDLQIYSEQIKPGSFVWLLGRAEQSAFLSIAEKINSHGRLLIINNKTPWLSSLQTLSNNEDTPYKIDVLNVCISDSFEIKLHPNELSTKISILPIEIKITLDDILLTYPHPNLLIINFKEIRENILKGAENILKLARPKVIYHVQEDEKSLKRIADTLKSYLYDISIIDSKTLLALPQQRKQT